MGTLFDYSADQMYLYENGKCTIAKIGQPMQEPCVSNDAKFQGSGVMGYGQQQLPLNGWKYTRPGTDIVIRFAFFVPAPENTQSFIQMLGPQVDKANWHMLSYLSQRDGTTAEELHNPGGRIAGAAQALLLQRVLPH